MTILKPSVMECFICKKKIMLQRAFFLVFNGELSLLHNNPIEVNILCSKKCLDIVRQQQLTEGSEKIETGE